MISIKQNNFQLIVPKQLTGLIILTGEDLYLINKFKQQIINTWHQLGDSDQLKFELNSAECWQNLLQNTKTASLFFQRQLFVAYTSRASFDLKTHEIIKQYLDNALETHNLVLIIAPILNQKTCQALSKLQNIDIVQIKTPGANIIKQWIAEQLNKKKYIFNNHLVELIYNQTEGNLLATAQGLTKIMLCYPDPVNLTSEMVLPHVSEQFIFQNFEFSTQILNGNPDKALLVLRTILKDQNEFHLMLWQTAQILRQTYKINFTLTKEKLDLNSIIKSCGIWSNQISAYKKLSQNLSITQIHKLLNLCQIVDYSSKTGAYGQAVRQLEMCVTRICNAINGQHI
jgi:DNA polymerase III delta subunit